jgi:hypothetical protein
VAINPDGSGIFLNTDLGSCMIAVDWYVNAPEMPNYQVTSVSTDGTYTTIAAGPTDGGNRDYFNTNDPYKFSVSRLSIPSTIILPQAKPAQIKPKCGDGTIEIWWNAPPTNGIPVGSPGYVGDTSINNYFISITDLVNDPTNSYLITLDSSYNIYTITGYIGAGGNPVTLTNGVDYKIGIGSANLAGYSAYAYYRTVQPGLLPPPPTNAAAVLITRSNPQSASVTISWNIPSLTMDVATLRAFVVEAIPTGIIGGSGQPLPVGVKPSRYQAFANQTSLFLTKNMATLLNPFGNNDYDPLRYIYVYNVYTVNDVGYSVAANAPVTNR